MRRNTWRRRFWTYNSLFKPRSRTVGTGSTASCVNNEVLKGLRIFSCSGYGTLHTVLPLRQTPATDGRLLDVDAVSLWPELDMCCRNARMRAQLAP